MCVFGAKAAGTLCLNGSPNTFASQSSSLPGRLQIRTIARSCAFGVRYCRLAKRTPAPPPFSEMNSMPALSRAPRIAFRFAMVIGGTPSAASERLTVATPTLAASAKSSALQRINARAALIWAPEISFISSNFKLITYDSYDMKSLTGVFLLSKFIGAGAHLWTRLRDVRRQSSRPDHNQASGNSDHG